MNRSIILVVWLLAGCGNGINKTDSPELEAAPKDYKVSSRNVVQWKRAAVIEADLSRALALSTDELCKELGDKNCIREVHLVPLGGNEPYVSGLMKPSVEPLATTPAVIDRVLLSACSTRAERDAHGRAEVFTKLKFDQPLPAADDPAIRDTVVELYRRLLARDPSMDELKLVAALAEPADDEPALEPPEFAALACFSIGSSTEFLFF
jgi:hypothetical protein